MTDDVRIHQDAGTTRVEVRGRAGTWVRLTGRNPGRDAAALLEASVGHALPRALVLVGGRAGHTVRAAFSRWPGIRIVLVEPAEALAAPIRQGCAAEIEAGVLTILTGPSFEGVGDAARALAGDPITVSDPVLEREWPDRIQPARAAAERVARGARANAAAREKFAARYLLQTLENLPRILRSKDAGMLFGTRTGQPAVVVGAGPSLDDDVDALRVVRDRAVVIAVDTALRPLLFHGIEPDYVVAVDPTELNARHLSDLPACPRAWLVAEGSLHPRAFSAFGDRVLTFRVGGNDPWPWLIDRGVGRAVLKTWGSVLTAAFDLALQMGCDPIVFLGADLAYTAGRPYCRGTVFEADWAREVSEATSLQQVWKSALQDVATVDTRDLRGNPIGTAEHLLAVRDWLLERVKAHPDRTIGNGSCGGILHGPDLLRADLVRLLSGSARIAGDQSCSLTPREDDSWRVRLEELTAVFDEECGADLSGEWRRMCDSSSLRAAIDRARHAAGSGTAAHAQRRAALRPRLWPAERKLAELDPAPVPDSAFVDPARAEAWLERASDCLCGDGDRRFEAFDVAIAEAMETLGCPARLVAPQPATPILDLTRTLGATAVEPSPDAVAWDRAARLLDLAARARPASHASVCADVAQGVSLWVRRRSRECTPASSAADVECRLEIAGGNGRLECRARVPLEAIAHAFTGVVRRTGTRGFDESTFNGIQVCAGVTARLTVAAAGSCDGFHPAWMLSADSRRLPWEYVNSGFDRTYYVAQLPDAAALVVDGDGGRSARIDSTGLTTRPSWAEPIVGELPWGMAGGAVAWTGGARAIALLRRHDGAPIERCALGGHAYVASVQSDGRIVWPTIDAGIRYWQPATGESGLLVPSPAVGGVRTRPDGLEFDPIVITEGPAFPRIRLDYTWAWSSGAAELCRRPASAEGQCFAEVEDRQRQAGAYPFSDLVRIGIDGGRFDLHVPHPLMLAWAGEDLLVSTGAGRLLRFKDVAGNLA